MKAMIYLVHVDSQCGESPEWRKGDITSDHDEIRTYSLCANGLHASFSQKVWSNAGIIWTELVEDEPAQVMTRCDGSCAVMFNVEELVREDALLDAWHDEDKMADEAIRLLREASSDPMYRKYFHSDHDDGDGHTWNACNGSAHFIYSIDEFGMPASWWTDPCDLSCNRYPVRLPSTVLRYLRKTGQL